MALHKGNQTATPLAYLWAEPLPVDGIDSPVEKLCQNLHGLHKRKIGNNPDGLPRPQRSNNRFDQASSISVVQRLDGERFSRCPPTANSTARVVSPAA